MLHASEYDSIGADYEARKQQIRDERLARYLDRPVLYKVGPKGYIHGWIKVGSAGELGNGSGKQVFRDANNHHFLYKDGKNVGEIQPIRGNKWLSVTPGGDTMEHSKLNDAMNHLETASLTP